MTIRKTRKNKLRKLRGGQIASPLVTTLARSFNNPYGIAVDTSGNVYVSDTYNNCIKRVTPAGVVTVLAGSTTGFSDATGTAAKFNNPMGIAIDTSGNIIVADALNRRIRKVTPAGVVTTVAGSTPTPGSTPPVFEYPVSVAIDSNGNIFVSDETNRSILKITPEGVVSTIAGGNQSFKYADGQGTNAAFGLPAGIAVDANGNIFVADTGCNCIRRVTPSGDVTTIAGYASPLNRPIAMSTDPEPGGYVNATGLAAKFSYPRGLAIDASGNLIVTDFGNNRIRRVTPAGVVTTIAGSGATGATDGPAMSASFNDPTGVAIDAIGNTLIIDSSNNRIRRISTGIVSSTTTIPRAPVYNNTIIYKLGDIITGPDGIVYRMIDGIGAAGFPPPRPTNWAVVTNSQILPAITTTRPATATPSATTTGPATTTRPATATPSSTTTRPTIISPGTYSFSIPCVNGGSRSITVTIV